MFSRRFIKYIIAGLIIISPTVLSAQTVEKSEIPPGLAEHSGTMLVRDAEKKQVSNCLEECFGKYYKGEYEIVENITGNSKYKDTDKYRFVFMIFTENVAGYWIGRERFPPTTNYSYGVMDRKDGKIYRLDYWAGGYKRSMISYIKKLETQRSGVK